MIASRLLPFSMIGLPLVFAACGGESLILPPEGEAARIVVLEETNNQSGRVTDALERPVVVLVTDSRDRPVADAEVVFSFVDGAAAGETSPSTARTNADGQASTTVTLGSVAGTYTGTAEVPVAEGITPVRTSFTVIALPADAAGIRALSGDNQTAVVNSALPLALVVEVTDGSGNRIPNVPIQWTAEGGGSVSAASTVTDANGQASVIRVLGGTAGVQTTVADAGGLVGSPVTFTSTALPGNAAGITKVQGDNQSGSPGELLALPLIVEVRDELNNPIADRPVTWVVGAGAGSVSAETTPTNAEGRATTNWTLGPAVGANSVNAVVSGVGTATFTATATAGAPSAANSQVSAAPSTIPVNGQATITVVVRDASNNPISGASVTVASSGTGNTITPNPATTGSNGVATFTFSSTVGDETKTITATAGGVPIDDGATITVQRTGSDTEIQSTEPAPSVVGQEVRVAFTVDGLGGTPTGQVTVTADGPGETCSGTVAEGFCNITLTAPGNRRLTARYAGDSRFAPSSDGQNHQVNQPQPAGTTTTITGDSPEPSSPGELITVTFTVTSGSGSPTGTVEVTASGGGSCSATVTEGSCQLVPAATGTITLTATYQGSGSFTGSSDTEEHVVTPVPPVNTPPVANDDVAATAQDQPINAPPGSLTLNDSPPEVGDTYTTTLSVAPTNGTATVGTDGSFVYTPAPGYTGPDSFEYTLSDGRGGSDTAIVSISVGILGP